MPDAERHNPFPGWIPRVLVGLAIVCLLPSALSGRAAAYSPTRVTTSIADESGAIIDWEGGTMYYESNRDGRYHLYARPVGGGAETQLTFGDADDHDPALNWDGTHLAFTRIAWWTAGSLHTIAIDGSELAQRTALGNDVDADTHPAWSPDGQRLYFVRHFEATGQSDIYQVNMPGGGGTVFVALGGNQTGPRISNDGRRMVFASDHLGGRYNVFDLRISVPATLTQLTFSTNADDPIISWGYSPDDARVLYSTQGSFGQSDLYEVTRVGGGIARTTYDNCVVSNDPGTTGGSYAPDGSGVYFTSYRSGEGHADIWRTELPAVSPGVALTCPTSLLGPLAPGAQFTLTFRLCNFTSTTRVIPWCRSDLQGWINSTCGSASVPANSYANIYVYGTVPATADFCDTNRVTINATGLSGPMSAQARILSKKSLVETTPAGSVEFFALPTNVGHFGQAWSRDGQYLYYSSTESGDLRIYRRRVTGGPEEPITVPPISVFPPHYDSGISFSADGSMMAFSRMKTIQFGEPFATDIHVIPSGGGTAVALTNYGQGGFTGLSPEWWPDGSRVVFVRGAELAWVPSTGGTGGILLSLPGSQTHPKISRDGQHLAFGSNHLGGNFNIFECPLSDLTAIRQVTFETDDITPDEYSADGSRMLAQFAGYNTHSELVEIDRASGAILRRLTWDGDGPTNYGVPHGVYSPIDERIAFSSSRVYTPAPQLWLLRPGITGTQVCAMCPGPVLGILGPGESVTVPLRFCNCGGSDASYTWSSVDDLEWSTPQGGTVFLARGQQLEMPITLTAPAVALNATSTNMLRFQITPDGNPEERVLCAVPVQFEELPTLIEFVRFEATSMATGVRLAWEPAAETPVQFHVWRHNPASDAWIRRSEQAIQSGRTCEYLDVGVERGVSYRYRLESVTRGGAHDVSGELAVRYDPPLVLSFSMVDGAVMRRESVLELTIPNSSRVSIRVVDVTGRLIRRLTDEALLPDGTHSIVWDGRTETGDPAGAGVYFVRASIRPGRGPEESRVLRLIRVP